MSSPNLHIHERARARRTLRDKSSKFSGDRQVSKALAQLKQRRREQLKEWPLSTEDPYGAAFDADLISYGNEESSEIKTSQIFDIEGDGVLVHIPSSQQMFPLSSLFVDNLFLSNSEREYIDSAFSQDEGDMYSIVNFWEQQDLGRNGPFSNATNQMIAKLLAWVYGSTQGIPSGKDVLRIAESLHVGLYTPIAPPKACTLVTNGTLRASERFLYEAATTLADINLRTVFGTISEQTKTSIKSRVCNMYFGEGSLQIGTDPLEHYNRRPPLSHSAEHDSLRKECSHLDFNVRPPGYDETAIRGGKAPFAELKLHLTRMALYDHPLFSPEDRLYAQLRLLYGEYHRHLKAQTNSYLKLRLQMLLHAAKRYQSLNASMQIESTVTKLCADCLNTLSLLAAEVRTTSQLAEALYTTWNQLKGLRQHQNFISTPAKLVAINVHHTRQSTYRTNVPLIKELLGAFNDSICWIASHVPEGLRSTLDHNSIFYLFKKYRRLLMSTSDFVLKLYTTAELTYDDDKTLPIQEVMRRRRVRQQRLYVTLVANEHQIINMQPRTIDWPAFTIQLEQPLRLRVSKRPVRFEMELWQRRLMIDLHLATVLIPVPGMAACHDSATSHSLVPVTEWVQFASSCITWDVKFVIGDDVEVFFSSHRPFPGFLEQIQHEKDGTWIPGVVAAVRWRCYDIRFKHRLRRAIPPSRLRRKGAIFEVRQRQLTGAVLVSLQWVTNDMRVSSTFWMDSCIKPPQSYGLRAEIPMLPPRPNKSDKRSNTDPLSPLITSGPSPSSSNSCISSVNAKVDHFDPNDPRCTSLVNRVTLTNACETAKLSHVYRTGEARSRLAFRAVRGVGAPRQLIVTSSQLPPTSPLGATLENCGSTPPPLDIAFCAYELASQSSLVSLYRPLIKQQPPMPG